MTLKFSSFSLQVRFSFFALLFFMLLLHARQTALLCFCSAMLHECGHFLCLWLFGARIRALRFSAAGVEILRADAFLLPNAKEAAAALGGVLVNVLLALCALLPAPLLAAKTAQTLFFANLALAALNLLPAYPLDLWRALHALLEGRLSPFALERLFRRVSFVTVALFAALTAALELFFARNLSLLAVCVYLIIQNVRFFGAEN